MKIVTMISVVYIEMARNFLLHLDRAHVDRRDVRFYCLDAESANAMGKEGADVVIHGLGQYPREMLESWTPAWRMVSFTKLEILTRELRRGSPFLYMDVDIATYIDPRSYIGQITGVDAVCQVWITRNAPIVNICAGLMALWPTDGARRLVAPDFSIAFESDQHLINHRVAMDHTIRWLGLPPGNFPDAHYPWRGQYVRYLTHYNRVGTAGKEADMRAAGDWLV